MVYKDIKLEAKIAYLKRILAIYVRFLRYYTSATVNVKKDSIEVVYGGNRNGAWFDTQAIEFPISHLSKRIEHYKRKVKTEFKNRHNNPYWK